MAVVVSRVMAVGLQLEASKRSLIKVHRTISSLICIRFHRHIVQRLPLFRPSEVSQQLRWTQSIKLFYCIEEAVG